MKKIFMMSVIALVLSFVFTSCKPYQKPVWVEVGANETAYVIPMETGNKAGQTKMKSEAYLEQNKVATQRIYVPTQWIQTGRGAGSGKWIESIKVIKVDRTPVTREWNGAMGGGVSKEAFASAAQQNCSFMISFVPESGAFYRYKMGASNVNTTIGAANYKCYLEVTQLKNAQWVPVPVFPRDPGCMSTIILAADR